MAKEKENNRNVLTMSLNNALGHIEKLLTSLPADKCPAIVLIGPPGLGKTCGLTAIGDKLKYKVITRHLSQVHPLDLGGVGLDNTTRSLYFAKPPLHAEVMGEDDPPDTKRLLILDEIDRVQPIAQNAMLQILSERKQNGYKMENTYVVAAANGWYAQYTYELDKAFGSRLLMIHVESSTDEWLKWALDNKVHTKIITCVSTNPDVLNQHKDSNEGALKVADPRAWESLSHALWAGADDSLAAGYVGEYAAQKFIQASRFLTEFKSEIQDVLKGKEVVKTAKLNDMAMFGIYLAASGRVNDIKQARHVIVNSRKQLGDEKAYITGRLITYNIPVQELTKDEVIHKAHMEMVQTVQN